MPELPQMQALAERLDAAVGGRTLVGYEPIGFSSLKTVVPAPDVLVGRVLTRVGRRGKYLVAEFDGGHRLLLHLSQAGRLDVEEKPKRTRGGKGGVVRLRFVLHGTDKRRIHTWLRDQRTVVGVGRGYSDDALWRAGLSPYSALAQLDDASRGRLLDAVRGVLADGLTKEQTRTGGLSEPKLGAHFEVHGRAGTPCPRCGAELLRVSYESHEVVYCAPCQTGGKVLADRRMSRLLK